MDYAALCIALELIMLGVQVLLSSRVRQVSNLTRPVFLLSKCMLQYGVQFVGGELRAKPMRPEDIHSTTQIIASLRGKHIVVFEGLSAACLRPHVVVRTR